MDDPLNGWLYKIVRQFQNTSKDVQQKKAKTPYF